LLSATAEVAVCGADSSKTEQELVVVVAVVAALLNRG